MRTVAVTLPPRVLTDHATTRLAETTLAARGHWFRACDARHDAWPAHVGGAVAAANDPDPGLRRIAPHRGRMAVHFAQGTNGGFQAEGAVPDTGLWSAAVVWASGDSHARSLLAVRARGGSNYIYLAENEPGTISLSDDEGGAAATLQKASGDWQMSLVRCAGGRLALADAGSATALAAGVDGLPPNANLLVGCRSHRPGIRKTLGAAIIAEVLVWPGLDLLASELSPPADEARNALAAFFRWEY